jgi:hypothetical protein
MKWINPNWIRSSEMAKCNPNMSKGTSSKKPVPKPPPKPVNKGGKKK